MNVLLLNVFFFFIEKIIIFKFISLITFLFLWQLLREKLIPRPFYNHVLLYFPRPTDFQLNLCTIMFTNTDTRARVFVCINVTYNYCCKLVVKN